MSLWRIVIFTLCCKALWMVSANNRQLASQYILYNIEVDNMTGAVYVGGENIILQATKELQQEQSVVTGPKMDNPNCLPPGIPPACQKKRTLTNNRNKILLIDQGQQKLITCGSVYFGACQLRDLNTLSVVQETIDKNVASSSPYPSVAFIAPGSDGGKAAMYVGSTWLKKHTVLNTAAAVASVSLQKDNLFDFVEEDFDEPVSLIKFKNPSTFIVKYIYGFSSGMFSYFVQVQETSLGSGKYQTTIGRVCHKDKRYASYVEMPLVCQSSSGSDYNIAQSAFLTKPGELLGSSLGSSDDALFVAFGNSTVKSPNVTSHSAVCLYSIKKINQKLSDNIKKCFAGLQNEGMAWTTGGGEPCTEKKDIETSEPFCPGQLLAQSYTNSPIGGEIPATASAVLLYDSAPLTSIAAMPVNNYTAIFLGTKHGHLLKASNEEGIYEDLVIDSSSAVKQLKFSADNDAVYALSDKKVTMVPLQDCDSYKSCDACAERKDPFCGWCTLYKKCSQFADCAAASLDPSRYARQTSQCIRFISVTPDKIPVRTNTELEIVMANLPPLPSPDQKYKCFVNGAEQTMTVPSSPAGEFRCGIPKYENLPPISGPKGAVLVDLEIFSSESNKRFVGRKIAFYDCSLIKGCRDCSEGEFTCDWCLFQGICSGNGSTECAAEVILARERRSQNSKGCPRLQDNQTIYIPEGMEENFVLKAQDLPLKKTGLDYTCVVDVDGKKFDAPATRDSDTRLTCSPQTYSYAQSLQQKEVSLSVWRGRHEVYRPGNVSVTLYKCAVGRPDCSICLVADERFNCGWCPRSGPCVVEKGCKNSWISRNLKCNTVPNITQVWPMAGPTAGGTEIEIQGVDLGKSFDDVKDSVTIGKYKCVVDPAKYKPARRIYCNTSTSNEEIRDFVAVEIDGLQGKSPLQFSYQNPVVLDFNPKKGPQSGGSLITITGKKLNTGRTIEAFIGNTRCVLTSRMSVTDESLQCVTAAVTVRSRRAANETSGPSYVTLAFDGYRPSSPPDQFIFTPDPVVTDIEPKHSILSGGLKLKVTGNNFASIQEPKIFFTNPVNSSNTKAIESCQVQSNAVLMCLSPNASIVGVTPDSRNGSEVNVGFVLDGVPGLEKFTTMAIKRDPLLRNFEDGVQEVTKNLILAGEHLGSVTKQDVRVTVQGIQCNITSMSENQIVCREPAQLELPEVKDELYIVEVVIGNRKYNPGKMKYFKFEEKSLPLPTIIGIAVGAAVLFFFVILFLSCMYCRKRKQQQRNIRTYEARMNNLESKVARECREAFAELQTDMTDLTNNMSAAGMPFLPFRKFALHVLFPGSEDHPIMRKREYGRNAEKDSGLRQFSQMLNNKEFLLVFIRTLEAQLSFQMKDRCNVASLLIVALQGKLEYVTEILRHLLCDLIRKSVAKSHPKLLLRRTESVAEKLLTNWLAFCMYNFLRTEAGEPLFMLFKAIKTQTEKGPIDGLTGDARYSLSEDKLLRQTTDYKELTVRVKYEDQDSPFTVVLLDCDTIGQAKDKILDVVFKNKPFSEQPDKDTLQLEWLRINERTQAFRDDDSSSLVEGEWRKLNTLQHYQLPDGALLQLVSRQSYFYSSTDSVNRSRRNLPRVGFSPSSYTPIMVEDGAEGGGKIYHLVKSAEYVQEKGDDSRHSKLLSEIYLTRLLATKGTLQQFVDRLFATVFIRRGTPIPIAIKFLFDLLDEQARELNLTDPEVLHTWKNNSLPLRFWINMIKNPNFIFDVKKPGIVDSCLSVIAQLFMDACSVSEHKLGKDSPSNKLLYAKELPAYRQRVESFYNDIQKSRAYSNKELSEHFAELSAIYGREFSSESALEELYEYVLKYQDQLQDALEEDGQMALTSKIEMVIALMTDDLV